MSGEHLVQVEQWEKSIHDKLNRMKQDLDSLKKENTGKFKRSQLFPENKLLEDMRDQPYVEALAACSSEGKENIEHVDKQSRASMFVGNASSTTCMYNTTAGNNSTVKTRLPPSAQKASNYSSRRNHSKNSSTASFNFH